jgi:cytidylate kinase
MTDPYQTPSEPCRAAGSNRPLVIAIDGPSGSGKSSTAKGVAERLGLARSF